MNPLLAILTFGFLVSAGDTLSLYAQKLVNTALAEHETYHRMKEKSPVLCKQIQKYWQVVGAEDIDCVAEPWSAVFVSYCVKVAGATASEFRFADSHSQFVHQAIRNTDRGEGVFKGVPIDTYVPQPGDIVQANRTKKNITYEQARHSSHYKSHSAIVVKTGKNLFGRYACTIGGNERDTVRKSRVKLHKNGLIKQRKRNPYICVIRTLK